MQQKAKLLKEIWTVYSYDSSHTSENDKYS